MKYLLCLLILCMSGCAGDALTPVALINFPQRIGTIFIVQDEFEGRVTTNADTVVKPQQTFEGHDRVFALRNNQFGGTRYSAYEANGDISVLEYDWVRHPFASRLTVGRVTRLDHGTMGHSLIRWDTVLSDTTIDNLAGAKYRGIKEIYYKTTEKYSLTDVLEYSERVLTNYNVWVPQLSYWALTVYHPGTQYEQVRRLIEIR